MTPIWFARASRGRVIAMLVAAAAVPAFNDSARAEEPTLPAPAYPPKPPPYSLPFQLRPVVAGNVVRSDTAIAFLESPANGESGTTVASMLLASYKVTEDLAPLIRIGAVSHSPPDSPTAPDSALGFLNPVIGATYAIKPAKDLRLGLFLGLTVPIGSGGGDDPDPAQVAARSAGIPARSAMDNAMFAVNDFTVFPGVGLAYVKGGVTLQVEATVLQLTRVRGSEAQTDASRTNFTTGAHLGFFVLPLLSWGAEIRHQRWLSTPDAIRNNEPARDTTTFALGPRLHFKISEKAWLRPAVAFALPLDDPMRSSKYKILQVDVPFVF